MARITIASLGRNAALSGNTVPGASVETGPSISLLNAFLSAAIPIRHDCGGKAACGTCRLRVISGGESLSPKTRAETERLAAMAAPDDWRLACQTHARKDAVVEIPGKGGENRSDGS